MPTAEKRTPAGAAPLHSAGSYCSTGNMGSTYHIATIRTSIAIKAVTAAQVTDAMPRAEVEV